MSAAVEPSSLAASRLPGTGEGRAPSQPAPTHSYVIRLALELDGELIEERYVEPMEIVHIGHEQRSNLLCWGRLPRSVQLFEYDRARQPVVLVSPRWLTQKNTHPLSISPHSHPSQVPTIPTPLLPGQCFTLDLDGALLHIERLDFFSKVFDPTHLDVPTFSPDTSSLHAPKIALCSLVVSSLAYLFMLSFFPNSPSFEEAPQLVLAASTPKASSFAPPSTLATPAPSSRTSLLIGAAQPNTHHASTRPLEGQLGHPLSWEEREVQRLLQSRSHHYRACFDASHEEHMMNLFFDLKVVPSSNPRDASSSIEHVDMALGSNESRALLDCIVRNFHEVELPRYEQAFMVEFNILFEPSSP